MGNRGARCGDGLERPAHAQRGPRIFTSLLYTPITSSGPGHMPMKRLARVFRPSSSPSDTHIAPSAIVRKKFYGIFAACCSMKRVIAPSACSARSTGVSR
jgi:hypothetical protein